MGVARIIAFSSVCPGELFENHPNSGHGVAVAISQGHDDRNRVIFFAEVGLGAADDFLLGFGSDCPSSFSSPLAITRVLPAPCPEHKF